MKKLMRRSVAFMLVVCTLLSVMAPAAVAITDNGDGSLTYNFAYDIASGNERPALNSDKFIGDFVAVARNNSNVKTSASTLQFQSAATTGDWYALKFNVQTAGYYDIGFKLHTQSTTAVGVDLHILAGDALAYEANNADNQTAIDGSTPIVSTELIKNVSQNPTVERVHFETAGNYLLVIEMTTDLASVVNFTGFTMTDVTEEVEAELAQLAAFRPTVEGFNYIYTWTATDADRTSGGYPVNYTGYFGNFAGHANSSSTMYKPYNAYMQIQSDRVSGYIALRINVPVAGNYNISFDISGGAKILDVFFVDPDNMATGNNNADNATYVNGLTGGQTITVGAEVETITNVALSAGDHLMVWRLADGSATGNVNFFGMTLTKIVTDQDLANEVIDLIDAIGEVTLNSEADIQTAQTAFDALTPAQQALVTNKAVLDAAKAAFEDLKNASIVDTAAAQVVIDKIAAIGEVTLNSEDAINDAQAAYDALTPVQQALVTNIDVLTAAKTTLQTLKDMPAAQAVIDLINAIGEVTLNSETAINEADAAYELLTDSQKALVNNKPVLDAAKATLAMLQAEAADRAAAQAVIDKIDAIGTVTAASQTAVAEARAAYNALTASQKALISEQQLKVLKDAEFALINLSNPNPDANTFDGLVYDFTSLSKVLSTTNGSSIILANKASDIDAAFTAGNINYTYLSSYSKDSTGMDGYDVTQLWTNYKNYSGSINLMTSNYAGAWMAVKIKAPAAGTYKFQFYYPANYTVNLSTKVDAFMLPYSDIEAAAANATVGEAINALLASGAYNPVASKDIKGATNGDPKDADDFWGEVTIDRTGEYVVIFRATENKHGSTTTAPTTSNVWMAISGFSLTNPATPEDIAAAETVSGMIDAIGVVTRDSKTQIEAAIAAYGALTDKQKELVENYSVLTAAKARLDDILDTTDGIEYIYKDPGNPKLSNGYPSGIGHTYGDFIDYARSNVTAFKPLAQSMQTQAGYSNGRWYALRFDVAQAGDYDLALNLAAASGHLTTLDVYFVRADSLILANANEDNNAFVNGLASDPDVITYQVDLTDNTTWNLSGVQLDQDAYVVIFKNTAGQIIPDGDSTKTINYMFNFRGFKISRTGDYTGPEKEDTSVEDNAAAKVVIDKINAIGTVTLNSEAAIADARAAYKALMPRQQALVTNYGVLTAAEEAFAKLKYDNAVADVIGKIDAIGTVTLNSYSAIKTAREAYEKLDAGQKTQVTNYQKLLDAETKIVALRNPNPDDKTFDGYVFDFIDANDVLGCTDGKNVEFSAENLDEAYAKGTLGFSSLGGSTKPYLWNNYKNFGNTMGVMVMGYAGAWFAVRVKAAATGSYRFQFYYPATYNVNLSTKIDAYMIPMSEINKAVTADKTADAVIAEMIKSGKYAPVASKNVKTATNGGALDEHDFWGNVQITKGEEYAVIFRATENKHGGTNPETLTSNVWLMVSGFSLATPPSAADIAAAEDVMAKIDAIGVVTANSGADIKAARDAYDKLTEKQQGLVENYNLLVAAEERLADILDTTDGIEYIYKDPGNSKLPNGYPDGIGYTYGDFMDYARSNVTVFKPLASNIQTQAGFTNGKWFGLKFDVAQAGDYNISLNLSQVATNAVTLDVYFVRADSLLKQNGNSKNQEFIDSLATSKDVKTYKVDLTDKSTWNLSGVQLDKDAYVIIFKNTAGLKPEGSDKATNTMFNFTGFKALRTGAYTGPAKVVEQPLPDPNTDKFVYDFYYGGAASGTKVFNPDLMDLMNKEYALNKQNWVPFAMKVNTVIQNSYSATYLDGTGNRYPWTGMLLSSGVGEWIAVQIKAPGTGTYDLTLEHGKNVNGSTTGKVYVIPASALKDASVETIEAAIADDTYKLINSASFRSSNDITAVTELGQAEFEKGKDYIVVILASKNKHGSTNPYEVNKTTGANELYEAFVLANKLVATKFVAPDPLNKSEVVYNFFREDFAYGTNIFSENALGTLMTEYIKGTSYWKPYASTIGSLFEVGGATYVNESGKNNKYEAIMVSGYVGEMLGIQIKSPGTGLFNVELTYGLTVNGTADGEVYFIPASKLNGDLSNVEKLIENGDYKLQRDVNFKAGYNTNKYKTTLIGQLELKYGEEYVVVFRAASNKHGSAATVQGNGSPYQAFMILKEMKLTKTNTVIDKFEDPEEQAPDVSGQADPEAAAAVIALIDAIGDEITLDSASAITTARTAYDLLTENQKALVTNYQKLVDAETKLAELVTADDKAKADEVIAKIDAIGEVTLEAEGRIVAARIAYTLLTNSQRALVTNYATLLAAEAKLAELKGEGSSSALDQASADAVAALIDKIGTVTLDSEMYISAARNAYNALTDAQKLLVGNYATLVAAERAYAELKAEHDAAIAEEEAAKRKSQQITIMIVAAVIAAVAAAVVAIFAVPGLREKVMLLFAKAKKGEKK